MQDVQYQWLKCSLPSTFEKKWLEKKSLGNLSIVQVLFPPHPLQYVLNKLEALYFFKILDNINSEIWNNKIFINWLIYKHKITKKNPAWIFGILACVYF